jgi:pimeloyl-ACP methyl ester carboxylesterase
MTTHTHQTAPTQYVEANGIRFAYRRFRKAGGLPLVFNQHYTGTMDHWDPAVTDGFAKNREVILFDNAGVSSSSGEVPPSFEHMGTNAVAFIKSLGLPQVDLLGFSFGGFVTQEIALAAPQLVRPSYWWGLDRAAVRAWRAVRRKATGFSERSMTNRITFGSAFSSRRLRPARQWPRIFETFPASDQGS